MEHTLIPKAELDMLSQLKDIRVIFDVGARTDTAYFGIFPDAAYHLFEPYPPFYNELYEKVKAMPNVTVNGFGLGDSNGHFLYHKELQAFSGGEAFSGKGSDSLPVMKLDDYMKNVDVSRIDFLKIDTEGYDFKVIMGGWKTLPSCRYIQYEHWDNKEQFHILLRKQFDMEYIGYRNVLCMNKRLVSEEDRKRIKKYIRDNKLSALT